MQKTVQGNYLCSSSTLTIGGLRETVNLAFSRSL